jgi:hypothetical protein
MKQNKSWVFFICAILFFAALSVITGCSSAKLIEYSSTAEYEQKVSLTRTEMRIIKSDNEKVTGSFYVVSAVDHLIDGKKNYYLMIVPAESKLADPKIDDLLLQYDYRFIIHGQNLNELIVNLEKSINEWNSPNALNSGVVYNFLVSTPQNSLPFIDENRLYEITPFIKFNYSKTENGAIARLALGNRIDEIKQSVVDGKIVKNKIFIKNFEQFWIFKEYDSIVEFHTLLSKGLVDLKEKGLGGFSKKTEVKAEVKIEESSDSDSDEEIKPKEASRKKKPVKRKK